ncbi:MAG TPA: hypothetical protein VFR07_05205 [Mycobacteriales bacterium]|jgi:hypothetical protein|nr:hypothetical protein [Mycobacteriales bacterium]
MTGLRHGALVGAALAGLTLAGCGGAERAATRPPTVAAGTASPGPASPSPGVLAGPGPSSGGSSVPGPDTTGRPGPSAGGSSEDGSVSGASSGPLEVDPAVAALRAYYVAAARAVNADDLDLPELRALSTPRRQDIAYSVFLPDRGGYVPGPTPFTPLAVTPLSDTRRAVLLCAVESGWVLAARGGPPLGPDQTVALRAELVLQDADWQVDLLEFTSAVSCSAVPLDRRPFA